MKELACTFKIYLSKVGESNPQKLSANYMVFVVLTCLPSGPQCAYISGKSPCPCYIIILNAFESVLGIYYM